MRSNRLAVVAVGFLLMLAGTPPASAEVAFDMGAVPPDEWSTVTLRARVPEPGAGDGAPRHNVRVTLWVPGAFVAGWCASPPGWECWLTEETGADLYYTWERTSGPFGPEDAFDISLRAPDREDEYPFPARQHSADGTVTDWDGSHPDRPAPRLRVVARS